MNGTAATDQRRLIFLTGFMGSGKSTIGPILANTIGYDFVDTDRLVEQKANARVVEIFEKLGEQRFREFEDEVLRDLLHRNGLVISLGGGTIATEENFQNIHSHGIIVYLRLDQSDILQRVQHRKDRPLLWDGEGNLLPTDRLNERIATLFASREQFYNRADVIVASDRRRVGVTVDEIVRRLRDHL